MKVNLHIERLVLRGLPIGSRDAAQVKKAVRAELTRLLAIDPTVVCSLVSAAMPSARGMPLRMSAAEDPPQLGAAIAQSVYGGLSK